jgi:hypothetical protein
VPVQHTCKDAAINIIPKIALILINKVLRANSRSLNILAANGNTTDLARPLVAPPLPLPLPPLLLDDPVDMCDARGEFLFPLLDVRGRSLFLDEITRGDGDEGAIDGVKVGELRVTTIPPYPGRGIVSGVGDAPILSYETERTERGL